MPKKSSEETAYAFLHAVLGKFGACAEVVTDQGTEFQGAFAELLANAFIEHRHTSAYHPQANGLAERCVQTVKRCLSKLIDNEQECSRWDTLLPWVALGYRITPQESTRLSPYQMLYAQLPMIPSAVRESCTEPLDFDGSDLAATELLRRAHEVARQVAMAGQNMVIAQQRDTLRYARVHDGSYVPKLRWFEVGDYVYTKRSGEHAIPSCLRSLANPEVLRVRELRASGVVVLEGRDGQRVEENIINCAPCHLPIADPSIDYTWFRPPKDYPCRVCSHPDNEGRMLLCDACHDGYHLQCLDPPLKRVPRGAWFCPSCNSGEVAASIRRALELRQVPAAQNQQHMQEQPVAEEGNAASALPCVSRGSERGGGKEEKTKPGPLAVPARRSSRLAAATCAAGWWGQWWPLLAGGESLEGEMVLRQVPSGLGQGQAQRGVLRKAPEGEDREAQYIVHYESGEKETLSAWEAWVSLLPEGSQGAPEAVASAAAGVFAQTGSGLAHQVSQPWALYTVDGVRKALQATWSDQWPEADVSRVFTAIQQWRREKAFDLPAPAVTSRASTLMLGLDLWWTAGVVDMFAGLQCKLALEFERFGVQIQSNLPVSPEEAGRDGLYLDPLRPSTYSQLHNSGLCDAIITCPPVDLLELFLPLAVEAAGKVVCVQVPATWATTRTGPMARWLGELEAAGRVQVLLGQFMGPHEQQAAWLIVFRTALMRQLMAYLHKDESRGLLGDYVGFG